MRASANRLSACGRALRPWLGRTLLPAAVLDPSEQASPAEGQPCRMGGVSFTAARVLGASASEVAQVVDGRYAMACCQRNNVVASVLRPVFIRGARTDSSFVIFALKCIIKYLVDSWVQGIVRMAVIANINRDRNVAMDVTFVAPLPKSHVSLLSDDVTFPT